MLLITFAGLRIASAPVPRPLLVNFTNGPAARTQQGTAALAHALDDAVRTMPANSRLLAHLALALQALAGDGGAAQGPPASGLSDAQLRRALAFIEERFSEPLKLADMAAACALSPGHFARAFQASTDKTPYRWLLDRRIAEAQRLLAMTTTPLLQVALACGFASQSHFTRIFRNTTGTPPGVWRRSATTFG
ncbi:helix-turn-helix domain-containing protein [Luteibacter sp. 621]|uniref:helix-turn-helix domain-containing protein n=1 Tax=Luteibacter sp. 621 TaxID=3373916 RepID=UPI003D25781C